MLFSIPKAEWGPGPWQDEPDRVALVHAGLDSYVLRSPVTGAFGGYVAVPPSHPWWGRTHDACTAPEPCEPDPPIDFEALARASMPLPPIGSRLRSMFQEPRWSCAHRPSVIVDVHGGLTFSGPMIDPLDPRDDRRESWVFGFDAWHLGDVSPLTDAALRLAYRLQPHGDEQWAAHEARLHAGPFQETYKPLAYVQAEVCRLAEQIARVTP